MDLHSILELAADAEQEPSGPVQPAEPSGPEPAEPSGPVQPGPVNVRRVLGFLHPAAARSRKEHRFFAKCFQRFFANDVLV